MDGFLFFNFTNISRIPNISTMNVRERRTFFYNILRSSFGQNYFEIGSGGSTNAAAYFGLHVWSVESDLLWHQALQKHLKFVNL